MSRLSPDEFARIQLQKISNPELLVLQMATRSLQNYWPEDIKLTVEQLKKVWPDQMAEIGEKMAKVSLEELTAMSAMFGSQVRYEINAAAEMLKKQGNELHSQGKYISALKKYIQAKQNLKDVSSSSGRKLRSACSLNMMSCYLKTKQFEECINEGTEVLAYDASNLKALYRRGQAYKELGKLKDAVCDLIRALEVSPADETIAEALRDVEERLMREGSAAQLKGLIIEEIVKEATASSEKNCIESESEVTSQEKVDKATASSKMRLQEEILEVLFLSKQKEFAAALKKLESTLSTETRLGFHEYLYNAREQFLADLSAAKSNKRRPMHNPLLEQMGGLTIAFMKSEMMLKVFEQIGCKVSPEGRHWLDQCRSWSDFVTLYERDQEDMRKLKNRLRTEKSGMFLSMDVDQVSKPEITTRYFFGLG